MKTALLVFFVLALSTLSMNLGGSELGFTEFLKWLTGQSLSPQDHYIFLELRLPRTLTCLCVGASLALSGLLLQALLDNPLAEPYTLGLSGGATLGTLSALLMRIEPLAWSLPLGGILGSSLVTGILLSLIQKLPRFRSQTLILFGNMTSLFCGSLVVLLISILEPAQLSTAIHWMMGACGTPRDAHWPALACLVFLAFVWITARHRSLDTLLLGEDLALTLGSPLKKLYIEIIVVVALLTTGAVYLMGLVGFVGLIAPHMTHRWLKSRRFNKTALPTMLIGALLLLSADIVGRMIGGVREIPAGGLVALLGAPFLMILLLRNSRHA